MQQAAIEQLQRELAASREEQDVIKAEARQVSTMEVHMWWSGRHSFEDEHQAQSSGAASPLQICWLRL